MDSFLIQRESRASLAIANFHRACEAQTVKTVERIGASEGLGLDCLELTYQIILELLQLHLPPICPNCEDHISYHALQ